MALRCGPLTTSASRLPSWNSTFGSDRSTCASQFTSSPRQRMPARVDERAVHADELEMIVDCALGGRHAELERMALVDERTLRLSVFERDPCGAHVVVGCGCPEVEPMTAGKRQEHRGRVADRSRIPAKTAVCGRGLLLTVEVVGVQAGEHGQFIYRDCSQAFR